MSNNYWDEDEDDLDTTGSDIDANTKGIRDLRKAKRADEARIKELTEKLATLEKAQSERTVKEILEQKGVTDPRAMKNLLRDIEGEVNEQSVNDWLATDGDLYGYQPEATTPAVSDADRAAIVAQDSLTQGGVSPERNQDLEYRIEHAQSQEELNNILYSANNS